MLESLDSHLYFCLHLHICSDHIHTYFFKYMLTSSHVYLLSPQIYLLSGVWLRTFGLIPQLKSLLSFKNLFGLHPISTMVAVKQLGLATLLWLGLANQGLALGIDETTNDLNLVQRRVGSSFLQRRPNTRKA